MSEGADQSVLLSENFDGPNLQCQLGLNATASDAPWGKEDEFSACGRVPQADRPADEKNGPGSPLQETTDRGGKRGGPRRSG